MKIILASKSASRRKVMDSLGIEYEVISSNFDEKSIRDKDPCSLARKLSIAKAKEVGTKEKDAIIISGDTFAVFKGTIYEKPKTEDEAKKMIKSYENEELIIVAGMAIYNSKTKKMKSYVKEFVAKFGRITDSDIKEYMNKYPVTNYAAALDDRGLKKFTINYDEIMSKPICLFVDELKKILKKNLMH